MRGLKYEVINVPRRSENLGFCDFCSCFCDSQTASEYKYLLREPDLLNANEETRIALGLSRFLEKGMF